MPSDGSAEQRGILVAPLGPDGTLGPAAAFRGSWLELAPPLLRPFVVGDRVALDPGSWRRGDTCTGHKCLGEPSWGRFGVVVAVGPVRDGAQRNVDVLAVVGSGGPGRSAREGGDVSSPPRSLYPAAALVAAVPAAVQAEDDAMRGTAALVAAVRAVSQGAPDEAARRLVETATAVGPAVWSDVVTVCGAAAAAAACVEWYSRPAVAVATACTQAEGAALAAATAVAEAEADAAALAAVAAEISALATADTAFATADTALAAADTAIADADTANSDADTDISAAKTAVAAATEEVQEGTHPPPVSLAALQGCGESCTKSHKRDGMCLVCGKGWATHIGHACRIGDTRGSWRARAEQRAKIPRALKDASKHAFVAASLMLKNVAATAGLAELHSARVARILAVAPPADDSGAAEWNLNASLKVSRRGLDAPACHIPMLEPLDTWQDWRERRDAGLNSAMHHAAALGLRRTCAALAARSSGDGGSTGAEWEANAAGETPAALLDGVPAAASPLHRLLRERSLVPVAMARALCSSSVADDAAAAGGLRLVDPDGHIDACATALQAGQPEAALAALEPLTAAEGSDAARCARVYSALALIDAGYGPLAAAAELDAYAAESEAACAAALAACAPPTHVDPLYLYARYAVWAAAKGGEASSSRSAARLAAASALAAARLFPAIAGAWIDPSDDLDVRVAASAAGTAALADSSVEHDAHDAVAEPEPAPGTPE